MGQNQSTETGSKAQEGNTISVGTTFEQSQVPGDSTIVCCHSLNGAELSANTNLPYVDDMLMNTPLFTFLSGFYQKEEERPHVFFQLGYDDICRVAEFAKNWKILPYTGNPEEKGIIYWIGCLNVTHRYENPIKSGMIIITTSKDYHVNYSRCESCISRVLELPSLADKDCYFDPGCIIFHFPNHMIHPTGYTYRNGGGRGSVVRKWVLEASTNIDGPWSIISNHPEDDTFFYDVTDGQDKENSFLPHCWPIKSDQKQFFSFFKLQSLHTHPNGRSHALYISGFELYGIVRWSRK